MVPSPVQAVATGAAIWACVPLNLSSAICQALDSARADVPSPPASVFSSVKWAWNYAGLLPGVKLLIESDAQRGAWLAARSSGSSSCRDVILGVTSVMWPGSSRPACVNPPLPHLPAHFLRASLLLPRGTSYTPCPFQPLSSALAVPSAPFHNPSAGSPASWRARISLRRSLGHPGPSTDKGRGPLCCLLVSPHPSFQLKKSHAHMVMHNAFAYRGEMCNVRTDSCLRTQPPAQTPSPSQGCFRFRLYFSASLYNFK